MKMVFTRRFCSAHRLMSDKSLKCQNPHGHNWEVKVTVEQCDFGRPITQRLDHDVNMVEEFGAVKKKWHTWIDEHVDHSIMLNENDQEFIQVIRKLVPHTRMMLTPGDPTTEITCALFMSKLNAILGEDEESRLLCTRIELIETPTNTVVFEGNELDHLDCTYEGDNKFHGQPYWWARPDMSTLDEWQLGGDNGRNRTPEGSVEE